MNDDSFYILIRYRSLQRLFDKIFFEKKCLEFGILIYFVYLCNVRLKPFAQKEISNFNFAIIYLNYKIL